MNLLRDYFFPCPGFPENQHTPVGWRHEVDLLPQRLHGDAFANDRTLRCELFLKLPILNAETLGLHRVLEQDQRLINRERFFQKIVRA